MWLIHNIDWRKFGGTFVEENLGYTTLPDYTNRTLRSLCSIFDLKNKYHYHRFRQRYWTYVSMEYFKQKIKGRNRIISDATK
jgi:adenylosuccinate lyase